jgi:hypothetical protein
MNTLILEAITGQRRREDRSPISWAAVACGAGALALLAVLVGVCV